MAAFERDISDAAKSIVVISPYMQAGRVNTLLPALQSAISRSVTISICTRAARTYNEKLRNAVVESISQLQQMGVAVRMYEELQQHCAIIDKSVVWYGNVDFLAFGRKDSDVLRFENVDIAGELSAIYDGMDCEQLFISDVDM